jgi:hypothetical protein
MEGLNTWSGVQASAVNPRVGLGILKIFLAWTAVILQAMLEFVRVKELSLGRTSLLGREGTEHGRGISDCTGATSCPGQSLPGKICCLGHLILPEANAWGPP